MDRKAHVWSTLKRSLGEETAMAVVELVKIITEEKRSRTTRTYSDEYEDFWKAYPRKVGKPEALKAYTKARKTVDNQTLIEAVQKQTATAWKDKEIDFIPHPATWLNQGRWMDEITEPKKLKGDEKFNEGTRKQVKRQYHEEYERAKPFLLENKDKWEEWKQTNFKGMEIYIQRLEKETA